MEVKIINGVEYAKYDDAYWVSKSGDVYSCYKHGHLKHYITIDGHHRVDIHGQHKFVHRLVYECWVGPVNAGFQVNHKDDDKNKNCLENLYAGTQKENIQDCFDNNHRVGNIWTLIVEDKQINRVLMFSPAKTFLDYAGHTQCNGGVKRALSRDWFKERYTLIAFQKGVTTMGDECTPVGLSLSQPEAHRTV